jgi:hypothetical protein
MSEESDRLRLGGMALANGLLVHGPTSWAAAVVDDDGEVIVGSGPRPRLHGGLLERVPLARGVIRMVESMMVVPAARAGVPEARLAMEDRPVGVMVVGTMVASALLRRRIKNVVAQEAAVAAVNLLPILLMLRLSPASRWHAVEHKSIAAYERAGSLGIATNVVDPKEHPRCGSNLVLPLMVSSAVGNIAARAVRGRRRRALVRAGALVAGIGAAVEAEVRRQTIELARALGVVGLVNVQYAIRDGEVYVLEANPRASRTVPFVAKATGIPLVDAAVRVALGERVEDLNIDEATPGMVSVKEAVLPFARFPGADALLGPEMRATGEVMGTGPDFATAFAKAQRAAGQALPSAHPDGTTGVALTVNDRDKPAAASIAQQLVSAGFTVYSTEGTARALQQMGIKVHQVAKLSEPGDTIPDLIRDGKIALVINTPLGMGARGDGYEIRRAAVQYRVPCITTMSGAAAAVQAMSMAWKVDAKALQDLHRAIGGAA